MATQFPITVQIFDSLVTMTPNRRGNFWRASVCGERLAFFGRTPAEVKYKAFLHLGGGA